jgi:hypothetical protein
MIRWFSIGRFILEGQKIEIMGRGGGVGGGFLPLLRRTERVAEAPLRLVPRMEGGITVQFQARKSLWLEQWRFLPFYALFTERWRTLCMEITSIYPAVCDAESETKLLAGFLLNSVRKVFARSCPASMSFATDGIGTAVLCPKRSMNFYPRIRHFSADMRKTRYGKFPRNFFHRSWVPWISM